MADDDTCERLETGDNTSSEFRDAAVAEANESKSELVEQQKARTQYLKDGGISGVSADFGRPELFDGDGSTSDTALEYALNEPISGAEPDAGGEGADAVDRSGAGGAGADDSSAGGGADDLSGQAEATRDVLEGQSASGTVFVGSTDDLAELILDKLEEAQDEDTDEERAKQLRAEAHELMNSVKTRKEMEELEEALEDEDTYRDVDFESEVNADGQIVWWFRGGEAIDVHHPEEQLDESKRTENTEDTESKGSRSKVLSRDKFDELGKDVAKTLRDMGVQRIEITEDGDKKHVKLKLSDERKIETGHDVVTAVSLDDEVELDFSVGEDGSLHVSNIDGISGEIVGLPVGPDINSVDVTTNEEGEHVATVKVGPFDTERTIVLPDAAYSRVLGVLERLK